jgi:tetratricopeptide (TPR) repeat protein
MMTTDAYGLAVTTASATALETYDRAVEGLLGWDRASLDLFQSATAADPALALGHAGAAVCLFLDERFKEARAAAEAARSAAATQSSRERSHVEALALLVAGPVADAERAMRAHLAEYPRDLMVFQRLYYILFWQGRFPQMLDDTRVLLGHLGDHSFALGMHAFALEEADRCDEALDVAQAAIARNPRDAWAVHALAHALYEKGDSASGISALPPVIHPCQHLNWFRNHLLWHLALMHVARGDYARARRMSRRVFERAPSSIAGDLHDSISLLWRLELYDAPLSGAWQPFAAIARDRLNRQGLPFHAVHLAMALAAAGDWPTATRQLGMLRERAEKDPSRLVGEVVMPLAEGMQAFAGRDYATAVEKIEPLRGRIAEIGGSRAQRDVFHDTLLEACFRANDMERAERLLADRLARRADQFWTIRRRAPAS